MNLVSKEGGIATMTIIPDEVKPLQGYYLPDLLAQLAKRYAFAIHPTLEQARQTGAKFRTGRFYKGKKQIEIAELAIFNDGFAATTRDTSDAKHVVEEVFAWLKETLGFRDPRTLQRWTFQSDLVCDFENNVEEVLNPIASLASWMQEEMFKASKLEKTFHFDILGVIAAATPPGPELQFFIQRRVGAPLGSSRYFSKAHLPTDAHLKVLEKLDSELLGKRKKR